MAIFVTNYITLNFLVKPSRKKLTAFPVVDWSHEVMTQEGAEQFVHDIGFNSGYRRVSATEYVSKHNGFGEYATIVVEHDDHRGERATMVRKSDGTYARIIKKEG